MEVGSVPLEEVVRERGSSEGSDSERGAAELALGTWRRETSKVPFSRRRSARPFRLPAASARSLSRLSSRSRSSLFR